jgi:hypothetical protein
MGTRQHRPSRWKGQHSGDSLSPLLFLLYIEPLLGGSTSAGVDTDSAACPPRPHPTPISARMLTTSTVSTTVSDLRVQAQNSTCKRIQSAHKWGKTVATAALHRDVHTKLCTVTEMPRRVARQLEGQLKASTPNPSVLETPSATSGCSSP